MFSLSPLIWSSSTCFSSLFYSTAVTKEKKTDAQAHTKKLKYLPILFKLHIISGAWLPAQYCELSFENMLVLHIFKRIKFLEDKEAIFPTDPIYLKCNNFLTLTAGLQRQADLNSYQHELEI